MTKVDRAEKKLAFGTEKELLVFARSVLALIDQAVRVRLRRDRKLDVFTGGHQFNLSVSERRWMGSKGIASELAHCIVRQVKATRCNDLPLPNTECAFRLRSKRSGLSLRCIRDVYMGPPNGFYEPFDQLVRFDVLVGANNG